MESKAKAQTGCMMVFLAPFLLAGLGTIVGGVYKMATGEWKAGAAMVGFGLLFGGFACFFLFMMLRGVKQQSRKEELRQQFPDEPWKWQPEWQGGRIKSGRTIGLPLIWFFAIFWNGVSWPVATMAIIQEVIGKQEYKALFALLFPLIGIILLIWAVTATLRHVKFGSSWLEMASVPGVIGGTLSGVVYTGRKIEPENGWQLRLCCINRVVTGSGKNRSTTERIRWEEEQTLTRELAERDITRSAIPVFFQIPFKCEPTNTENPSDCILWRLEAKAETAGLDYETQFEVPVFRTEESSPEPVEVEDPLAGYRTAQKELTGPVSRGITVGSSLTGGQEFYWGAARSIKTALVVTVIWLVWTGAIVGMVLGGAPIVLPIIFGFFDLILLFAMLGLWTGTSRVTVEPGVMRIRNTLMRIPKTTEFPLSEVKEMRTDISGQTGTRPDYSIKVIRKGGKEHTFGGQMKNKREAEWLVAEMQRAVEKYSR